MYTRTNPFIARLKDRYLLTKAGSSKKTYHIILDIENSALPFAVGDSIGISPMNNPHIVEQIIEHIRCLGNEEIRDRTGAAIKLRTFLLYKANINKLGSALFTLLNTEKSDLPLLELLRLHPVRYSAEELCKALLPLMPRFYSIANSPKVFPKEIHLTVALSTYLCNGQVHYGVGSHFLCDLADFSTPIPIYVQPAHHFRLPSDPTKPVILIGPGTGIAPFRAFLQERVYEKSPGENWLFFGERNKATDFYYADYWEELARQNRLRLDSAFSRDQENKVYVQDKMWEAKSDLWDWIALGSYIYVCGDAEKMAKDVDATLQRIAHTQGNMNLEEARKFCRALRSEKRYLMDVY